MSIYSSSYLKSLSRNVAKAFSDTIINESANANSNFDIFLCHSFLDYDEVRGLYLELTKLGFKVYVDWIVDPHLDRNNVTKDTAEFIRNRLMHSKTLLLGISENAIGSKWIPWELGYMDAQTQRCAIIPVSKDARPPQSFKGSEFLSLYPFVKKAKDRLDRDKLWVIEGEYKYVIFDRWYANNQQPFARSESIYNV